MIKAVLFDKDGTLLEFESTWHRIFTTVFRRFRTELALDVAAVDRIKRVSGYRNSGFEPESIAQYMSTSGIIDRWAACIDRHDLRDPMRRIVNSAALDPSVAIDLLPGVDSTLHDLSAKRYHLGVATADSLESTRHGLTRAGILHHFSFLGCDDGTHPAKPDPSMAHEFRDLHGIAEHELLIVGDSASDREFARNAGARFVGIAAAHSRFNATDDDDDGAIEVIRTMDELIPRCAL
ncbi:MAG: HAD family hydrolase [Spirochaetota bacterium]